MGTVVIRRAADGFTNDEVCPECTFWTNFNHCDTSPNDSSAEIGLCDDSDSPLYTMDDGVTEFVTHGIDVFLENGDIEITTEAPDYIRGDVFGVSPKNTGGGDNWRPENDSMDLVGGDEWRCAFTYQYGPDADGFDHDEEHLSSSVTDGMRFHVVNKASADVGFNIHYDWGSGTLIATGSTTNVPANRWHMIEMAACLSEASSCTHMTDGDDSIELFIDGVADGSAVDATNMTPLTGGTTAYLAIGRSNTGQETDWDIGYVICTDDSSVDLWDRYAGRCTDGSTRCIDDLACGGGTCDNPTPQIDYPGA